MKFLLFEFPSIDFLSFQSERSGKAAVEVEVLVIANNQPRRESVRVCLCVSNTEREK